MNLISYVFLFVFIFILRFPNEESCSVTENDLYGFCQIGDDSCSKFTNNKYLFYDVNPSEGFNLRRDVYMRLAIFVHNLKKIKMNTNFHLVLPPFTNLYHWQSRDIGYQGKIPWGLFFDVNSLKTFAPVLELYELFEKERPLVLDRIYLLNNYENPFENGVFIDKWEVQDSKDCFEPRDPFWNYDNITFKNAECVLFQGSSDMLKELIDLHPNDKTILFTNAQIPLHEDYGSKTYWDARKSMKFNTELVQIAEEYIQSEISCFKEKCDNYLSVHWRRGDFSRYRINEVPSINSTAKQIYDIIIKNYKSLIKVVFIATDATDSELSQLKSDLEDFGVVVKSFMPSMKVKSKFKDGGIAIIEQIICSHATYFVGTHESTFSFRIQEEREIYGFNSDTTFNRLCPDEGPCERPSRWKIVH